MSGNDYNPNSFDATLSRIEVKLDDLRADFAMHKAVMNDRVGKIERWKYWVMGASAAAGAMFSQALDWFKK